MSTKTNQPGFGYSKWSNKSQEDIDFQDRLIDLFMNSPIPKNEIIDNLCLYSTRMNLSRIMFLNDLYREIINIPGVIIEFGPRWGANLALFSMLRGMYEPFNHTRKILGFDSFQGFVSIDEADGSTLAVGDCGVCEGYENHLEEILLCHELESPISQKKKFELRKGDAAVELNRYLQEHPETTIAYAHFDLVVHTPTRRCLEMIKPLLTKGSIVSLAQFGYSRFPGETLAFQEVFGSSRCRLQRSPISSGMVYFVFE